MRTKKRIAVLPLLFVASIAGVQPAEAAVTFYSNLASWQLSANTTTVLDLNLLAPVNGFVSYGSPGSVDLGPLTLGSTGPLFAQNNNLWGTGGYLSAAAADGRDRHSLVRQPGHSLCIRTTTRRIVFDDLGRRPIDHPSGGNLPTLHHVILRCHWLTCHSRARRSP